MNKIEVIIITKNEGKKISRCIEEARKLTTNILVVDTGSIDETNKIAKNSGAKVVKFKGSGSFADWRNFGIMKANAKWVLYIDADEIITSELTDEISKIINSAENLSVYAIPRRNFIFNKEFRHCGQWPDYQKRLLKVNNFEKWVGEVHEEPLFKGELGHLKNPLIHNQDRTISDMVSKTNKWSEIEAKLMLDAHHPPMNLIRFFSAIFREFWLRFIKQTAFLDGPEGIVYGCYQVFSKFVSYAKLWEMQQK